jgi:VWFA-related protein
MHIDQTESRTMPTPYGRKAPPGARRSWPIGGWAVLTALALAVPALVGQEPPAPPSTQAPPETPTFRAGVRLATVDAIVTDDKGRHVTDLTPADFEIIERGKRPAVRQAAYIHVVGPDGAILPQPTVVSRPADATTGAPSPARIRKLASGSAAESATAARVMAIVVDDLSFGSSGVAGAVESAHNTRQMLTGYVDGHLVPGDLVAILRTSGGAGTLQQFTTDQRLLRAAIDRVRFSFLARPASFDAVTQIGLVGVKGPDIEGLRSEMLSIGTLGALEYALRSIETLPGRKSVIFVSEGFDLGFRDRQVSRVFSSFQRVMDHANRAGVVVYTIDPRGLQSGMATADSSSLRAPAALYTPRTADPGASGSVDPPPFGDLMRGDGRQLSLRDSQESLLYLAQQTGGFAVVNNNDLTAGLVRAIADTNGYYLLGFETAIAPNARWDSGDIRIRVKRRGLKVRSRRGLFGPAEEHRPKDEGPADPLVAAALLPFASGTVDVRLTTLFAHDKTAGSFVRTLFFIDPAGLTFSDGPDGRHDADLSLLTLAIGDDGQPVEQLRLHVPLRLDETAYRQLRQQGLLYSARMAIKKPGGYQIRAAVQDGRSKAIGASAQFVEVPAVRKGRVALSGVVLMDAQAVRRPAGNAAAEAAAAQLADDVLGDGVLGEPAIKIFKPGTRVIYTCEVYDGREKRDEGFSTQATIMRDGKAIYTSPLAPIGGADDAATPVGTVRVGGTIQLGPGLPPGIYTLQVSVGASGKNRSRQASQWSDFEVRP